MIEVTKVVFHGIYENDLEFFAALALWGGLCLPNPRGMMDLRLRLPGLFRALQHTRFGSPLRGYAAPRAEFYTQNEKVAKWGNWHCGKNIQMIFLKFLVKRLKNHETTDTKSNHL